MIKTQKKLQDFKIKQFQKTKSELLDDYKKQLNIVKKILNGNGKFDKLINDFSNCKYKDKEFNLILQQKSIFHIGLFVRLVVFVFLGIPCIIFSIAIPSIILFIFSFIFTLPVIFLLLNTRKIKNDIIKILKSRVRGEGFNIHNPSSMVTNIIESIENNSK
ncbi:MAG: hypothetical protein KAH72_11055 [Flavobacteriaceae bacterium]|nr:hypothetical protein [Flavobacteriaceae bacterium]